MSQLGKKMFLSKRIFITDLPFTQVQKKAFPESFVRPSLQVEAVCTDQSVHSVGMNTLEGFSLSSCISQKKYVDMMTAMECVRVVREWESYARRMASEMKLQQQQI